MIARSNFLAIRLISLRFMILRTGKKIQVLSVRLSVDLKKSSKNLYLKKLNVNNKRRKRLKKRIRELSGIRLISGIITPKCLVSGTL